MQNNLLRQLSGVASATTLTRLLSLIILGYPAKILGPTYYGLFSLGASISAYVGILLLPGIAGWGSRQIAQSPSLTKQVLSSIFWIRGILGAILYCIVCVSAALFAASNVEMTAIICSGIMIMANALNAEWLLTGLHKVVVYAWLTCLTSAINVALVVFLVNAPSDFWKYCLIPPLCQLLLAAISYLHAFLMGHKISIPSWSVMRSCILDSKSLIVFYSLIIVCSQTSSLVINNYLGYVELGIFSVSLYIFQLASSLPTMLSSVLIPRLSSARQANPDAALNSLKDFTKIYVLLGFLVAALVFSFSDVIIRYFFGDEYSDAVWPLRVFSVAIIFNFAIAGYSNLMIAFSQDRHLVKIAIASATSAIIFNLVFIKQYGIVGAAAAIVMIDMSGLLVAFYYYNRLTQATLINFWIFPFCLYLAAVSLSLVLDNLLPSLACRGLVPLIVIIVAIVCAMPHYYGKFKSMTNQ
jgi:O-antigen/teichoic acid export membrane protein